MNARIVAPALVALLPLFGDPSPGAVLAHPPAASQPAFLIDQDEALGAHHGAFDHAVDVQRLRDLGQRGLRALELHHRGARDDAHARQLRELGDQRLGHAVGHARAQQGLDRPQQRDGEVLDAADAGRGRRRGPCARCRGGRGFRGPSRRAPIRPHCRSYRRARRDSALPRTSREARDTCIRLRCRPHWRR